MRRQHLLLTTAAAVLSAGAAGAQNGAQTGTQSAASVTTIVVQGKLNRPMAKKIPLKSTFAASHISREEIEQASPVATAQQILNTEPSINATAAGPLGMQQTITFRAFNSAEFSETYDGVALNDVFNGGVTNQASVKDDVLVTANDFDSVDLYRGVNNPAVNSYNSLAGTINFNARQPTDGFGGEIGANFGSFDTIQYHVTLNTGKVDGVKQMFSFERGTSHSWLQNAYARNSNLFYAVNADTGSSGKLYANFIYDANAGEAPYDVPESFIEKYGKNFQYPRSEYSEPTHDTDYQAIIGTTQRITDAVNVDVKGFFGTNDFSRNAYSNPAYQDTGYYVPNQDPVDGYSTTYYGYTGHTIGLTPSVTFKLPYNTLKIGGNYTIGHLHSREYYGMTDPVVRITGVNDLWNEHDQRTLYSFYTQDQISLLNDRLRITPGVKYQYARTKDHDDVGYYYSLAGSLSSSAHFTSPTIGASYEFLPGTVFYGAFGQNIEFPTIDAYYNNIDIGSNYDQTEQVHLKPEHVDDFEAGLRYGAPQIGFNGALGAYLENFTNTFISATDPSTGLSTTTNGGSSRYKGIELQLAEDFGPLVVNDVAAGDFSAYLNYAYNEAYFTSSFYVSSVGSNNNSTSAVTYGTPVALVPRDTLDLGMTWNKDGWGANADGRYVTAQYIDQSSTGVSNGLTEPAYFVLNLGLSKTIPLHGGFVKSVKFSFDVDNLLNRTYDAYAYADSYTSSIQPASLSGQTYASVQLAEPRAFYGTAALKF